MKILIMVIALMATGCTTQHSFMSNAFVGYVDNQAVVLFNAGTRNGVKYYRPQFQSDCHYNKYYQDDNNSTECLIRDSRIVDLHPYKEHIPRQALSGISSNHDYIESVSESASITDNI